MPTNAIYKIYKMKGTNATMSFKSNNFKVAVCTLGCRVNQYESRAISEYLEAAGCEILPFGSVCDAYVINTCAVTAESERKSRQMARRAYKTNPNAKIIMTGCASQLHPEAAQKLPGVCYVGGNSSKLSAARAVLLALNEQTNDVVTDEMSISREYESYSVKTPDHTRAYVKIEDGCENRCAYCIIPKVRGPVRSKKPDEVLAEVRHLAKTGYKEIVLTGIETCSYQHGLSELIREIHSIDGIERIRLSSANPSFINKKFTDSVKDLPKFCPHFHLSLQSFCDKTLNAMRRKYNSRMIFENCLYLRENIPNICFTADMICGFPNETDEDFEITLQNTEKLGLLFAHIFPYSDRPGTEASAMKNKIEESVKAERCAALRATVNETRSKIISDYIDKKTVLSALIETEKDGYFLGHTENFIEVRVKSSLSPCQMLGKIFQVTLTEIKNENGEIVVYADKI